MISAREWGGLGVIAVSFLISVYVGIYLMLLGGIVQIANAVSADPVSSWGIAWGIVRILFCPLAFWLPMIVGISFGRETPH